MKDTWVRCMPRLTKNQEASEIQTEWVTRIAIGDVGREELGDQFIEGLVDIYKDFSY